MVNSGESRETEAIDSSVGALVWVRRRNGSWWPGKIVGMDELSEESLVSPKLGAPVKLLGRHDSSIDWYNLEKSKRVKAFRCGDFVECIKKAQASAANSTKKAVKYARREDAIIHALELEIAFQARDSPDFCSKSNIACREGHGCRAGDFPSASCSSKEYEDMDDDVSTLENNSNSTQEVSQSGLSFEEPNQNSPQELIQRKRRKTPNDSEDDGTNVIKRMRGLEDLGMSAMTNRNANAGADISPAQQGATSPCNSKKKISQVPIAQEFLKRKNRCRPLTKVLESSSMLSVPVTCDKLSSPIRSPIQGPADSKAFGLESNDSKIMVVNNSPESAGISCENGFPSNTTELGSQVHSKLKDNDISSTLDFPENGVHDKLFDLPFVEKGKYSAGSPPMNVSCSSGNLRVLQAGAVGRQSNQNSLVDIVSVKIEGLNESGSTSSATPQINNISQTIEECSSKWKSKGKRNSSRKKKQVSIKYEDAVDESIDYLERVEQQDGFYPSSGCRANSGGVSGPLSLGSCSLRTTKSREITGDLLDGFQHVSHKGPRIRSFTVNAELYPSCTRPQRSLSYRQTPYAVQSIRQRPQYPIRNYCVDSYLYDVNLEVRASYKPQHVPLVSLVSKIDGKAIVGHPLTVEVLDDGSSDHGGGCYMMSSSSELNDGTSDMEAEMRFMGKPNEKKGKMKHVSMQARFAPSNLPRTRKPGNVSKKTRKLSSFASGWQAQRVGVMIKPLVDKPKGPVIACVPLNVVFSRLNEAINTSVRPVRRRLTS